MTIRTSGELLTNIAANLADNNAGLISAADVRNNMLDIVDSISPIVSSGNTDTLYPFHNNVRVKKSGSSGGRFIAESGISFPNAPVNSSQLQVQPFLGVENIQHNSLAGLTTGDPHTQYLNVDGSRPMTGNLRTGNNWIGASGDNNQGIKFVRTSSSTEILTSGHFKFSDNSKISSGRGVVKAWINFDANGGSTPIVRSAYNVSSLDDLGVGKFRLTFTSGVLGSGALAAFGHSNARSTSANIEDFDINTVGLVLSSGTDPNRQLTVAVLNDAGSYVDADIITVCVLSDGPEVQTDSI